MSLVVRNLTKRFSKGGAPAVHDVSFAAPEGKITTLLGPSGSGKSTVLRMIAGLEPPDAGSIHLGEAELSAMPVQKRNVGFVFQSYALFQHMTVSDNVGFGLRLKKVAPVEIAKRVRELLDMVQLGGLGNRYPSQLSGGQRQRVAFARSLAVDPKVLLLDEPFGALDARVRIELREWLHTFHKQTHTTTVLVTHDQEEALELSQHIVVMSEGRVEQAGSPQKVYDEPATPFVAEFVGGANVLRGKVAGGQLEVTPGVSVAASGAREGASAQAFVRPHDIRIAKPTADQAASGGADLMMGRVERLLRVGAHFKVSLTLPSGESMSVQMPKAEVDSLGLAEGDRVMVNLRDAKVFVEDYSI